MKRGRRSAAELSVIGTAGVATVRRPEPWAELTAQQAEVWRRVVNAYAADRFDPGAQCVLAQLCRHVDAARKIAAVIRDYEEGEQLNFAHWERLLRAQNHESGRIAALATKLRLTPQSRYAPHSASARAQSGGEGCKPWE